MSNFKKFNFVIAASLAGVIFFSAQSAFSDEQKSDTPETEIGPIFVHPSSAIQPFAEIPAIIVRPSNNFAKKPAAAVKSAPVSKPAAKPAPQKVLESPVVTAPPAPVPEKKAEEILEGEVHSSSAPQTSYIYDLKSLIDKSKNNIKRVNEKIKEQAIYKRNQQREEKAREYYDRAMELFDQGKTDEAREYFEKSIRITENAEMKDYIRLSEKRFKSQAKAMRKEEQDIVNRSIAEERQRQQQVRDAYDEGVTLYKQKKFKASRDKFMFVEETIPEFKATRSYLKILEQDILKQDQKDLVKQKKEIARQQGEAESERVKEKDMWHKELELKERERHRKLMQQAGAVYAQGVKYYNEKDFIAAKEKFQEVEWVIPDYKSTRKYLVKLDKDIKDKEHVVAVKREEGAVKQEWQDELDRRKIAAQQKKEFEQRSNEEKQIAAKEAWVHYQAANELMDQKKYTEARDEFLAVQKIYPDFKATPVHLARLNKTLGIIETAPDKVEAQVKAIYVDAVKSYEQKDYNAAKLKFEQVEFMYPNFQSTHKYLAKIEKQTRQPGEKTENNGAADEGKPVAGVGPDIDREARIALEQKAEPVYTEALKLFEEKKFDEALKKFEETETILPNYKSTRPYIKRVNHQIKRAEQQRYKEEQTQQAEVINVLAKQANVLYQKILLLADDRSTAGAQKKFALVDRVFANMSKEQARLLAEIAEEEEKLRLEELAYEQEVERSEFTNAIDPIYQEAVRLYRAQKYDEAKAKFLEAQSKITDYRSSNRYLLLIDKQNQLLQQTIKDREEQIAQLQAKAAENAELAARMQIRAQERAMINELLARAEEINDEILALSKDRNFEAIKEKFAELEKIVDNLLTIRTTIAERENPKLVPAPRKEKLPQVKEEAAKVDMPVPAEVPADKPAEVKVEKKEEPKEAEPKDVTSSNDKQESEKVKRAKAEAKRVEAEKVLAERRKVEREEANQRNKLRQIEKQDKDSYRQAKAAFNSKNYPDARARFIRLEQSPKYAETARGYIEKIDHLALEKKNEEIERQTKERETYIEDRAKQEKMSFKIQEAHRDNRAQVSQIERIKAPVPVVQSPPRYPVTHNDYLSSLNLRGRRPAVQDISDQSQVSQMKEATAPSPSPSEQTAPEQAKVEKPSGLSPNEDGSWIKRRNQKKLSDRRKKYLEEKARVEEKAKEEAKRQEELKLEEERKKEEKRKAEEEAKAKAEAEAKLAHQHKIEQSRLADQKLEDNRKKEAQRKKDALAKEKLELKYKTQQEARMKKLARQNAATVSERTNAAAKRASQATARQKAQEVKLRNLYEQELRGTKPGKGFDGALNALEAQKKKESRDDLERQKQALRQEREEESSIRKEKERKISNLINQGQPTANMSSLGRSRKNAKDKVKNKKETSKPPVVKVEVAPVEKPKPPEPQEPPPPPPPAPQAAVEPAAKDKPAPAKVSVSKKEKKVKKIKKEKVVSAPAPAPAPEKKAVLPKVSDKSKLIAKEKDAERDAVRKKFENGLSKMYNDAISDYKNRRYKQARDKFSDIQDISPDYKRSRVYLDRIQADILKEQKRIVQEKEDKQFDEIQLTNIRLQKINAMNAAAAKASAASAAAVSAPQPAPIAPAPAPVKQKKDPVADALDAFEAKSQ